MKHVDYHWDHPSLARLTVTYKPGAFLFRQGDDGDSLFIIVQGIVELTASHEGRGRVVGLVDAGQTLGEKALLNEGHRRAFGARAKTETRALKIDALAFDELGKMAPELMMDLLKHMFQMAARRLDSSTELVSVLRLQNTKERFWKLLNYLADNFGSVTPRGKEFWASQDMMEYYLGLSPSQVDQELNALIRGGELQREGDEHFIFPPKMEYLPEKKARRA